MLHLVQIKETEGKKRWKQGEKETQGKKKNLKHQETLASYMTLSK